MDNCKVIATLCKHNIYILTLQITLCTVRQTVLPKTERAERIRRWPMHGKSIKQSSSCRNSLAVCLLFKLRQINDYYC